MIYSKNIKLDEFNKNVIIVFFGTVSVNVFNLVYQLIIAHRLSPVDFAAFNALISILVLVISPLTTLQTAVAKYVSEFKARNEAGKIKALFFGLLKALALPAFICFLLFALSSGLILEKLKISSPLSGYLLAVLISISWMAPIAIGMLQGEEFFGWYNLSTIAGGVLKALLAVVFIMSGYKIAGALGALLLSTFAVIAIALLGIRGLAALKERIAQVNFKEFFLYLLPVAATMFCYTNLVNMDMILVKYFFSPEESGIYSLAQMVGKIFLFLPAAVSVVMLPRTSSLRAKNLNTFPTLKRALWYTAFLSAAACLIFNLFPVFTLKVLTGKAFAESILLARLFSVSMSFFTLAFVIITYFLSIKDFRFIKYLITSMIVQFIAIAALHANLFNVQLILCVNSCLLFLSLFSLTR